MKNEELKKGSDLAAFDELTDEQLEAVLGGFVRGGKTYETTFAASGVNLEELFKKQQLQCGSSQGGTVVFSTYNSIVLDAASAHVFTHDHGNA